MSRHVRMMFFGLAVSASVAACFSVASSSGSPTVPGSSGQSAPARSATQTSEGGQVTVVATWTGPTAGAAIDVALDTHSADLDALDLADATIRNDRGEALTARPWAAPKGGHHRQGALTFSGDGTSFFSGAKWTELTLIGVGDLPERTLRWEIGP